ncbi:MAG: DNA gyrase inhibitor YacG [Pseudomonadota bacterium]
MGQSTPIEQGGAGRLSDAGAPSARRVARCPICKAETVQDYRPFCSRRCADVDLARWLGGVYAIAGHADDDEDGDDAAAAGHGTPPGSDRNGEY